MLRDQDGRGKKGGQSLPEEEEAGNAPGNRSNLLQLWGLEGCLGGGLVYFIATAFVGTALQACTAFLCVLSVLCGFVKCTISQDNETVFLSLLHNLLIYIKN